MKIFRIILLLCVIIFTWTIVFLAPKMHKPIRIENPDFEAGQTVAWNTWYSSVSNALLGSVHLPQNEAVTLKNIYVKFEVDKAGNIDNISVRTKPAENFATAEKYVLPAIEGLQGKPALKFPPKSKRETASYSIILVPGAKTQYTTPSEFHDYEKIN